jgi:hypothetical protein
MTRRVLTPIAPKRLLVRLTRGTAHRINRGETIDRARYLSFARNFPLTDKVDGHAVDRSLEEIPWVIDLTRARK